MSNEPYVPFDDSGMHPALIATQKALKRGTIDRWGRRVPGRQSPHINVKVSNMTMERAFRVLQQFFERVEAIGGRIRVGPDERRYCLEFAGEETDFSISEGTKRSRNPGGDPKFRFLPTGALDVTVMPGASDTFGGIFDSVDGPIESRMEDLIDDLPRVMESIKKERSAGWAPDPMGRVERGPCADYRYSAAIHQKTLPSQLADVSAQWEEADRVRRFLAALEEKIGAYSSGRRASALRRLQELASRMDPLENGGYLTLLKSPGKCGSNQVHFDAIPACRRKFAKN